MAIAKLCILAAGRGTRVADYSNIPHKALIPLQSKAVISHIIEKFPRIQHIVVALGHEASLVKEYLEAAHPEKIFEFVPVKNYSGAGSGPGQSLLDCRDFLNCPFVLVCADTLWEEELQFRLDRNEIFVAKSEQRDSEKFCNFLYDSEYRLTEIKDKVKVPLGSNHAAFIGLATISDWQIFFEGLASNTSLIAGESQISSGFQSLLKKSQCNLIPVQTWVDTGNLDGLKLAEAKFGRGLFKKRSEQTFFVSNRVIKYYADSEICRLRIHRSQQDRDILPACVYSGKNIYAYEFIQGTTIRDLHDFNSLLDLLKFAQEKIWQKREKPDDAEALCRSFYIDKTKQRLALYRENGNPELAKKLEEVFATWKMDDFIVKAKFVRIHGDFQVGNIICTQSSPHFALIDFRQDFAGRTDLGDLYYDLGKLFASVWTDYLSLAKAKSLDELVPKSGFPSLAKSFEEFAKVEGLDFSHIKRMSLLIYLNMIGLHERQVADMLACRFLALQAEL